MTIHKGILDDQEKLILVLLAHGKIAQYVARKIGCSVSHMGRKLAVIYAKLGVDNMNSALVQATLRGIITQDDMSLKTALLYGQADPRFITPQQWTIVSLLDEGMAVSQIAKQMKLPREIVTTAIDLLQHLLAVKTHKEVPLAVRRSRLREQFLAMAS